MTLYYSPGACSMASHIALNQLGLKYAAIPVDLKTHQCNGVDFRKINPKGYVPTLQLEDGQILTENAVILQFIADLKPEAHLAPQAGTMERYRVQEWLSFIATEIHKNFSPLLKPDSSEAEKKKAKEKLQKNMEFAAKALEKNDFLTGSELSVADLYFYVMLTWAEKQKLDLTENPSLKAFYLRMQKMPSVIKTREQESASSH